MGFQVAFKSEKVIDSRMSAGRVPGRWSSNSKSATDQFGVYARNGDYICDELIMQMQSVTFMSEVKSE